MKIKKQFRSKLTRTTLVIFAACAALSIFTISLGAVLLSSVHAASADHFVTTWKTDNPGTSNSSSITIPTTGIGYNYDVDWNNDGVFDQFGITGSVTHDFGTPGTYTIRIQGSFPRIYFSNGYGNGGDRQKIININQWGSGAWTSMDSAFFGASNLTSTATDTPNLTNVTSMSQMFTEATAFNGDLSAWDTSSVIYMNSMFQNAKSFNGDISNWDTSNVTNMYAMFYIFNDDTPFNGDLSAWDTSSVTTMSYMFSGARAFNGDLSAWDTSSVTNMTAMFSGATSFNRDLSNWDTGGVTDMSEMFRGATSFNGDISTWDTSSVTSMGIMFYDATAFDQNIASWNISSLAIASDMLSYSGLSVVNYDALLNGWALQTLKNGVSFSANGVQYCTAASARQYIIDTFGWVIADGGDRGCDVYINDSDSVVIEEELPVGTVAGTLTVTNFTLRAVSPYSLNCTIPGVDDEFFTIGGINEDILLTGNVFNFGSPIDSDADNVYNICVRATDIDGNFIDRNITVSVRALKKITAVSFSVENNKKQLTIAGTAMVGQEDPSEYSQALTRSLVSLNNTPLPFCTDGTGYTAEFFISTYAGLGYDLTGLVSDDAPCYYLVNSASTVLLTTTQATILLPSDFDIGAPGVVSVNGSPAFSFNQSVTPVPSEPPVTVNPPKEAAINNKKTVPRSIVSRLPIVTPVEEDTSDSTAIATVTIDGNILGNHTIIDARPTFTGKAPAGSKVTVTVYSDPVTCSTVADSDGNWSCALAEALPDGDHSVYLAVVTPENETYNYGPYDVTVRASGDSPAATDQSQEDNAIDSKKEMSPIPFIVAGGVLAALIASIIIIKRLRR